MMVLEQRNNIDCFGETSTAEGLSITVGIKELAAQDCGLS